MECFVSLNQFSWIKETLYALKHFRATLRINARERHVIRIQTFRFRNPILNALPYMKHLINKAKQLQNSEQQKGKKKKKKKKGRKSKKERKKIKKYGILRILLITRHIAILDSFSLQRFN